MLSFTCCSMRLQHAASPRTTLTLRLTDIGTLEGKLKLAPCSSSSRMNQPRFTVSSSRSSRSGKDMAPIKSLRVTRSQSQTAMCSRRDAAGVGC
jgi:hypothetical protein